MTTQAETIIADAWSEGFAPEATLSVCEWADANIVLSQKSSSAPGKFRSDRTPYVKEILHNLSPFAAYERVIWIAAAQVAKTTAMLNWFGALIDQWPGPAMLVEPSLDLAKKLSKQKLAPMIAETAALNAKISQARSKDANASNTLLEKEFPGGQLVLTGANSAAGLRSMSIRYLGLDEVDAYPGDVEGEGSPVDLAEKRTSNFSRRKIFLTSTPTIKGASVIEREYLKTDMRKYYVPCPHCANMAPMEWRNITWQDSDPATVKLACEECGSLIDEHHKTSMLANGEWRATSESKNGSIGYHLNGLYSPLGWKSWKSCVQEWLDSEDSPEKRKVFVNTVLAETWEEDRGDEVNAEGLRNRIENYDVIPAAVQILTASVDVQDDRLEAIVKGWGAKEESWLVARTEIKSSPGDERTWHKLDEWLKLKHKRADGVELPIDTTFIDSGGHFTDITYRFCKPRAARRIFACKGLQLANKPIVSTPSTANSYKTKLYIVGVDAAKELVQFRMRKERPGAGYMHFPDWLDDEYFEQLTSEKAVRRTKKGGGVKREWIKTRKRNEAFDLEVYALAALYSRGAIYLKKKLNTDVAIDVQDFQTEQPATTEATTANDEALAEPQKSKWNAKVKSKWGSG